MNLTKKEELEKLQKEREELEEEIKRKKEDEIKKEIQVKQDRELKKKKILKTVKIVLLVVLIVIILLYLYAVSTRIQIVNFKIVYNGVGVWTKKRILNVLDPRNALSFYLLKIGQILPGSFSQQFLKIFRKFINLYHYR